MSLLLNAALRARVAAALGKAPDAAIHERELLALDLRGNPVADPTPLHRLPALHRLELGGGPADGEQP